MEVKKIIFKKQNDIISKYDKHLVLKNFVKEQHRKLGRLDINSHKKSFYDPGSKLYSYPDIMNFISEAAHQARSTAYILTREDC